MVECLHRSPSVPGWIMVLAKSAYLSTWIATVLSSLSALTFFNVLGEYFCVGLNPAVRTTSQQPTQLSILPRSVNEC